MFRKDTIFSQLHNALNAYVESGVFSPHTHVHRCEIDIPPVDPIDWVRMQDMTRRIYWSDRECRLEAAGIGAALTFQAQSYSEYEQILSDLKRAIAASHSGVRFYGGMRFDLSGDISDDWRAFGVCTFTAPMFEVWYTDGRCRFACNFMIPRGKTPEKAVESVLSSFKRIKETQKRGSNGSARCLSRQDDPEQAEWMRNIDSSLRLFETGDLRKVVLARLSRLAFNRKLDAYDLLYKVKLTNPHAFHFCFQQDRHRSFIGGTPELLYRRTGDYIRSEAVAGTRPRGKSPEEDDAYAEELLNSEKDRIEHLIVQNSVIESLQRLCTGTQSNRDISVVKMSKVQHLYSRHTGTLKYESDDAAIMSALHPTPAVGGHPKDRAFETIRNREGFDRGWYAGPVGWIGSNGAEFSVAIRSGLILGDTLLLYSGAGIVPGSKPESEWNEIENKISNFLQIVRIHA